MSYAWVYYKYKRREEPFLKDTVSPSVLGNANYTITLAMIMMTFLLNN
jgi:hypothetical protein